MTLFSVNSKILVRILGVAMITIFSLPVSAEEKDFNDIKFPEANWRQSFLDGLEVGPSILSKEDFFDVVQPPLNDSEETATELEYLRELAATKRTPETVQRIMYENSGAKAHEIFQKEGLIHAENYKVMDLFSMIDNDHMYFILERKKHFARARPNQLDTSLLTVIPNPKHAAYPSGHASQSYMVAMVLSDFDPENAETYKQFAMDIAHRREIAGVHYPSDSTAGRKLAVDVLKRLHEVPVFEKKYQDAKASFIKPDYEAQKMDQVAPLTPAPEAEETKEAQSEEMAAEEDVAEAAATSEPTSIQEVPEEEAMATTPSEEQLETVDATEEPATGEEQDAPENTQEPVQEMKDMASETDETAEVEEAQAEETVHEQEKEVLEKQADETTEHHGSESETASTHHEAPESGLMPMPEPAVGDEELDQPEIMEEKVEMKKERPAWNKDEWDN